MPKRSANSPLATQHATAAELDMKLPATGTMAASSGRSSNGSARTRACWATKIWRNVHIYNIFVNTIFREEAPFVVCRCGRGHDGTFLFAPANPTHYFVSPQGTVLSHKRKVQGKAHALCCFALVICAACVCRGVVEVAVPLGPVQRGLCGSCAVRAIVDQVAAAVEVKPRPATRRHQRPTGRDT